MKQQVVPSKVSAEVSHKFHLDYDAAAEKAAASGDAELQSAAEKASEAYDLTGMMAMAYGNDSREFSEAMEAAKVAAESYATIVRRRKNNQSAPPAAS